MKELRRPSSNKTETERKVDEALKNVHAHYGGNLAAFLHDIQEKEAHNNKQVTDKRQKGRMYRLVG